jgi:hypothetical protein
MGRVHDQTARPAARAGQRQALRDAQPAPQETAARGGGGVLRDARPVPRAVRRRDGAATARCLLYPTNLARPNTHEGGLGATARPGSVRKRDSVLRECRELLGGRYPFGVSFLGRLWADRRVLALAYAYEQATHHRRAPVRFGPPAR